jgi:hypothetical protein
MPHSVGARPPQLGGYASELASFLGAPAALIPVAHGASLWVYKNNAFLVQDEVVHERATPRLQGYLAAQSKTPASLKHVTSWLRQQPYLDYHAPILTDDELFAAFVKGHDTELRAKFPDSQPAKTIDDDHAKQLAAIANNQNPTYLQLSPAARTQYVNHLEQDHTQRLADAYQQALQDAFQLDLKTNYVLIPTIEKTTTLAELKSTLQKAGLIVEVLPQQLATPAGTLYAIFPPPNTHAPLKSTVTLYETK